MVEMYDVFAIVAVVSFGVFFGSSAHTAALVHWSKRNERKRTERMLQALVEEQRFFGDDAATRTAAAVVAGFKAGKSGMN